MGSVTSRISQNASLAYVEHDPAKADTWQLVFNSITSNTGGANGDTVIDTTRPSGVADAYNGRWWVRLRSGANAGLWKRVIDDDGAGTLTVERGQDADGFPAQVLSSVNYELWQSPEPVILVDSSSGATNVVDAVRDEADDFWEGYYLECIAGTRRGEKAQCTAFVSSTGTFTVGTGFSGALSGGDVCVLRRYIDVTTVNDGLSNVFNPRPMHRLDGSRGDGSVGIKNGTFGFEMPGLGVWRNGSDTVRSVMAGPLKACGLEEFNSAVAAGAVVSGAGSTTTAIDVATATWENYTIGAAFSMRGEQAFITGLTDGAGAEDTITVTPAYSTAPPDAETIQRTVNYRRNRRGSDGDYSAVTLVREVDGIRTTMTGCKGNVTLQGDADLIFAYEFQVDHYVRDYAPNPVYTGDAYESYPPILSTERRCYFGATAVELGGISASLNNEVAPRMVQGACGINGKAGFGHVGVNPGVTCRKLMETGAAEELDADERWFGRTSHDLMIFWGNQQYGNCAVRLPVARLVEEPKPEDDSGLQATPFVLEAMEAATATDPDDTVVQVPDFVISFS